MWFEIARKNIWEGYVEIKKTVLAECIDHVNGSNELKNNVWNRCVKNSEGYSKPRVKYLLDAFSFEGRRLLLDTNYGTIEEQILFAIIEYIKQN